MLILAKLSRKCLFLFTAASSDSRPPDAKCLTAIVVLDIRLQWIILLDSTTLVGGLQPFASNRLALRQKQVLKSYNYIVWQLKLFVLTRVKEPKLLVTMAKQLVWRSKLKLTRVTNQSFYCDVYLKV